MVINAAAGHLIAFNRWRNGRHGSRCHNGHHWHDPAATILVRVNAIVVVVIITIIEFDRLQ